MARDRGWINNVFSEYLLDPFHFVSAVGVQSVGDRLDAGWLKSYNSRVSCTLGLGGRENVERDVPGVPIREQNGWSKV